MRPLQMHLPVLAGLLLARFMAAEELPPPEATEQWTPVPAVISTPTVAPETFAAHIVNGFVDNGDGDHRTRRKRAVRGRRALRRQKS